MRLVFLWFEHKSCRKQLRGEQLIIFTRQRHLQIASVVVNLMDWSLGSSS